ncbi:MAG: hypothetical protein ACFE0P_16225 [Oceanicaulis sp.]
MQNLHTIGLISVAITMTLAGAGHAQDVNVDDRTADYWTDEIWTPAQDWTSDQQDIIDMLTDGPIGIEDPEQFERWASGFDEDWTVWTVGSPVVRRLEPHMNLVRDYVENGGATVSGFRINPVSVEILDDIAVVRSYNEELIKESDGGIRDLHWASVSVYRRLEDGSWTCIASNNMHMPRPSWAADADEGAAGGGGED